MTNGFGDGAIWLSRISYSPWLRLVFTACGVVWVAGCVLVDWNARSAGVPSPVARQPDDLWVAIGSGIGLGSLWVLWEWVQLTYRREGRLVFSIAPAAERLRWKYQLPNLIWNAWVIIPILALLVWCVGVSVSPSLPILAAMIPSVIIWRPVARFDHELRGCQINK